MVSKKAAPEIFYLPGGKPDGDEEPLQTLTRELDEELGVRPLTPRLLTAVEATAALEGVPMRMTVFETEIDQLPSPASELADLRWITGYEHDIRLAPALTDHVLPMLRRRGALAS